MNLKFQSTCPRGARPSARAAGLYSGHFNPRARVGHDMLSLPGMEYSMISIHVPAWGTTSVRFSGRSTSRRFQSTCPRGARPDARYHPLARRPISIHVPAWGTTPFGEGGVVGGLISIHVPAWGTTWRSSGIVQGMRFQSTCPRGARPVRPLSNTAGLDFNPRARVGHDQRAAGFGCWIVDFNPRARVGHDA